MDEHGHNVISHSVKVKNEGKHRRARTLTILGYVAFCIAWVCLCTIPVQLYPVIAGMPFFLYALFRITWWRLDFDFEYTLSHGELTVEKVFSHSRRRRLARVLVKDAVAVSPFPAGSAAPAVPTVDVRGSARAENGYLIRYRNEEGKETVLLFEATEKLVKMMARFNPATEVREGLPS